MGPGDPSYAGAPKHLVYFARLGNVIKIGTTRNLTQRMSSLGNPEVLGIMDGGLSEERRVHLAFDHLRITGEWFAETPEIHAYIHQHCRPAPPRERSARRISATRLAQRQMQDL